MDTVDHYIQFGSHTRDELIDERMMLADELRTLVTLYDDDDIATAAQLNLAISQCIDQIQAVDNMIVDQEEEDTLAEVN